MFVASFFRAVKKWGWGHEYRINNKFSPKNVITKNGRFFSLVFQKVCLEFRFPKDTHN